MEVLESRISTSSPEYKENFKDLSEKVADLRKLLQKAGQGGEF